MYFSINMKHYKTNSILYFVNEQEIANKISCHVY